MDKSTLNKSENAKTNKNTITSLMISKTLSIAQKQK
jgi:hypothetical protein